MEFSTQIKKYREETGMTQEELAEKIYVTRQTISNWENDRSYPDVKSLLLLSTLFQVSLDTLVKGDLKIMKEQIKQEDIKKLNRDSLIYTVLLVGLVLAAVPMFLYLDVVGAVLWFILWGVAMFWAFRIERQKKEHDIQSFREIVAFTEGRQLDELEKAQEVAKRPYQKVLLVLGVSAVAFGATYLMMFLLGGA